MRTRQALKAQAKGVIRQLTFFDEIIQATDTFCSTNYNPAEHREVLHELFTHWSTWPIPGVEWNIETRNRMYYHYSVIRDLLTAIDTSYRKAQAWA